MEKIKTGISGFDELLNGGIPKNKHVAIYGGPGCGKTSFSFEFLYRGAQMGEPGLYVTLQENEEELKENMEGTFTDFKDIDQLIKSKKLFIKKPEKFDLESVAELIEDHIADHDITRAVIDSATIIHLSFGNELEYRQTLFEFLSLLRNMDCTVLMTLEAKKARKEQLSFNIEHYVMDGIVNLYNLEQADKRIRALEIFKMRGTDHSLDLVPFKVLPSGIKVYSGERVF
ncbi:hypothetical protein KJ780_01725 [Candidatus Micrarchaeota archaeon]|nr:hypothetical protein [Candidatus Micrarchaeota archaeon]